MSKKRTHITLTALLLGQTLLVPLRAGDSVKELRDTDFPVRNAAEQQVARERKAQIESLLQLVEKRSYPDTARGPAVAAIRLLGELRAAEAVDPLIKMVDYRPAIQNAAYMGYPVVYELIEIGKPASEKALLALRTEKNRVRRNLLVVVVQQVEGRSVAEFLIETELKKDVGPAGKANLKAALEELKQEGGAKAPGRTYTPTWRRK